MSIHVKQAKENDKHSLGTFSMSDIDRANIPNPFNRHTHSNKTHLSNTATGPIYHPSCSFFFSLSTDLHPPWAISNIRECCPGKSGYCIGLISLICSLSCNERSSETKKTTCHQSESRGKRTAVFTRFHSGQGLHWSPCSAGIQVEMPRWKYERSAYVDRICCLSFRKL